MDSCSDDRQKASGELKSFELPSCLLCVSQPAPWDRWRLSFLILCYAVPTLGTSTSHFLPGGGKTLLASSSKAEEGSHEPTCPLLDIRKGSPNLENIVFSKRAPVSLCGQFVLSHPVTAFYLFFIHHNL